MPASEFKIGIIISHTLKEIKELNVKIEALFNLVLRGGEKYHLLENVKFDIIEASDINLPYVEQYQELKGKEDLFSIWVFGDEANVNIFEATGYEISQKCPYLAFLYSSIKLPENVFRCYFSFEQSNLLIHRFFERNNLIPLQIQSAVAIYSDNIYNTSENKSTYNFLKSAYHYFEDYIEIPIKQNIDLNSVNSTLAKIEKINTSHVFFVFGLGDSLHYKLLKYISELFQNKDTKPLVFTSATIIRYDNLEELNFRNFYDSKIYYVDIVNDFIIADNNKTVNIFNEKIFVEECIDMFMYILSKVITDTAINVKNIRVKFFKSLYNERFFLSKIGILSFNNGHLSAPLRLNSFSNISGKSGIEIDDGYLKNNAPYDFVKYFQEIDSCLVTVFNLTHLNIEAILKEHIKSFTKTLLSYFDIKLCLFYSKLNSYIHSNILADDLRSIEDLLLELNKSCVEENFSLERPIQINLLEDDYADNDTYRLFSSNKEENGISSTKPVKFLAINNDNNIDIEHENVISCTNKNKVNELYLKKAATDIKHADSANKIDKNKHSEYLALDYKKIKKILITIHENIKQISINKRITLRYCYIIFDDCNKIDYNASLVFFTENKLSYFALQTIMTSFSKIMAPHYKNFQFSEIQKAHCQSAIGQIMSRNGSHNIGSHVLAALSHNVGTMPDDRILYKYIQHRMDYIATVTTEFPNWSKPTKFVGDIMKEFFSQHHLLEYIAKSEGLSSYQFQHHSHTINDNFHRNQTNKIKIFIRKIFKKDNTNDFSCCGNDIKCNCHSKHDEFHAIHVLRTIKTQYSFDGIMYNFVDYEHDSKIDLTHDVDIAIPGGVIGKHAFYTILENIIRNAAKHGWSKRKESYEENLLIYIDFYDNIKENCIDFTIWDNMSNVFSYPFITDTEEKNKLKESIAQVLSKIQHVTNNEDLKTKIQEILDKKDTDIPLTPLDLKNFTYTLNNQEQNALKELTAENKNIKLPLHWHLQLLLDTPFIEENGGLRKENWGLYEMKISAGFLRGSSIATIGGLDSSFDDELELDNCRIMTPVAMPGICRELHNDNYLIQCKEHKDCDCQKRFHLGYQFSIPKPREILFVLDKNTHEDIWTRLCDSNNKLQKEYNRSGIYFSLENKEKIHEQNFAFEYVIVPAIDNEYETYCPYRLIDLPLIKDAKFDLFEELKKSPNPYDLSYCSKYDVAINDQINESNVNISLIDKIKLTVYTAWTKRLKSIRSDITSFPDSLPVLIQVSENNNNSKKSGQGLVTNKDILVFIFRENVKSILTMFNKHIYDLIVNGSPHLDEEQQQRLRLIYKDIKSILEKNSFNFNNDSIEHLLKLKKIPQDVYDNISTDSTNNEFVKIAIIFIINQLFINTTISNEKIIGREVLGWELMTSTEQDKELKQINSTSIIKNLKIQLVDYFLQAFSATEIILRKYEENISSLPKGYSYQSAIGNDLNKIITDTGAILFKQESGALIKYCRHDQSAAEYYSEALSGTQSYLNSLDELWHDKQIANYNAFATKLIENALLRILIIDERMSNFLVERKHLINRFSKMNIFAMDIEGKFKMTDEERLKFRNNPHTLTNLLPLSEKYIQWLCDEKVTAKDEFSGWLAKKELTIDQAKLSAPRAFDIIIIHQGIIDKWLADKTKENVLNFINKMQLYTQRILITTGRGAPENIPNTVKMLPFSSIENTMFKQYPEKLILVDMIMNALPKGGKYDK